MFDIIEQIAVAASPASSDHLSPCMTMSHPLSSQTNAVGLRAFHTSALSKAKLAAPSVAVKPSQSSYMVMPSSLSYMPAWRMDPLLALMPYEHYVHDAASIEAGLELMNRNKRKLKKANHGARPNNSRGRKARRLRRHFYS